MHRFYSQFINIFDSIQTDCGNNKRRKLGIDSSRMSRSHSSSQIKNNKLSFDDKSASQTDDAFHRQSKKQVSWCFNEFREINYHEIVLIYK